MDVVKQTVATVNNWAIVLDWFALRLVQQFLIRFVSVNLSYNADDREIIIQIYEKWWQTNGKKWDNYKHRVNI